MRNKSDGDWEEVAVAFKETKETDTMSSPAHDDMERKVNLLRTLNIPAA